MKRNTSGLRSLFFPSFSVPLSDESCFALEKKKIQSLFLLSHNQLILAPNILYFGDQKNLNVLDTEKPEEGVCTGALALIFLLKIPFIPTYLKVNVYYKVCQMNLYLELGITLLAKLF